jgi:hypothetical protein
VGPPRLKSALRKFSVLVRVERDALESTFVEKGTWKMSSENNRMLRAETALERVMNLGENRIEMRIPRSPWFPCDLRFRHS